MTTRSRNIRASFSRRRSKERSYDTGTERKAAGLRFLQHNHFCVEDVDDGTSLVTLELQRENLNRWGAPHGGTIFAMADIAAGMAALTVRQDVNVTASATIDYMAAAPGTGKLIARGRVRHAGGRLCYCATEITDETGKLIAELNSVMYYTSKPLIL